MKAIKIHKKWKYGRHVILYTHNKVTINELIILVQEIAYKTYIALAPYNDKGSYIFFSRFVKNIYICLITCIR